jgi:hypothetical protein
LTTGIVEETVKIDPPTPPDNVMTNSSLEQCKCYGSIKTVKVVRSCCNLPPNGAGVSIVVVKPEQVSGYYQPAIVLPIIGQGDVYDYVLSDNTPSTPFADGTYYITLSDGTKMTVVISGGIVTSFTITQRSIQTHQNGDVVTTSDIPGISFTIVNSNYGCLLGANVVNGGCGYTSIPKVHLYYNGLLQPCELEVSELDKTSVNLCCEEKKCQQCLLPESSCSCKDEPRGVVFLGIDGQEHTIKPTCKDKCFVACDGSRYMIVRYYKNKIHQYKRVYRLKVKRGTELCDTKCFNLNWSASNEIWFKGGWMFSNFEKGLVYLNYQGLMEDEEGNLLVPDHPYLNEYYEYAIKQRLLENLFLEGDAAAGQKLQLIEQRYRAARNNAISFVNTPDFEEIRKVYEVNRKAMYNRFESLVYNLF